MHRKAEAIVDETFAAGTLRNLAAAGCRDIAVCVNEGRYLDAGFSAAHILVLGLPPTWLDEEQTRMISAWQTATHEDSRSHRYKKAAWRCAYLRMLGSTVTEDLQHSVGVLRAQLREDLSQGKSDVPTAGSAIDLWLTSGEWMPDAERTKQLLAAVHDDVLGRLQGTGDDVMRLDRITLWVLVQGLIDEVHSYLYGVRYGPRSPVPMTLGYGGCSATSIVG